jgi:hypothetical protein
MGKAALYRCFSRRSVELIGVVAFGVLLALAMTWPLALHAGSRTGNDVIDPHVTDPLFQSWQVAWIGHALLHQPLHLFQANIFWPLRDSLAFSDALVGYGPAGLVAQRGPEAALVVYNLLFLFAYSLAFVGAYLLAQELGLDRAGTAVAGVAFAYAPWRLAHINHLQVLSSGGIPFSLFLLVRGYRQRSARLTFAGWLVASWQITLGFTLGLQFAYLLAILVAAVLIVWLRRRRPRFERSLVVATALGMCVFVFVSIMQARPYFRVIHDHPEARRTTDLVAHFSPPLKGFLAAPKASFLWGDATAAARNRLADVTEQSLFPGATIVLLALLGLAAAKMYPRRLRFALAAGAAVCAVLSVGLRDVSAPEKYVMPYRFLYEFAPGWGGIRTPGRINTLTSLGLAILAGAGFSLLLRFARTRIGRQRRRLRVTVSFVTTAVVVGAILLEGLGPLPLAKVPAVPRGLHLAAGPRLELPIDFHRDDALYSYWSTAGFPKIVNGYGAFEPTSFHRLRDIVERFPSPRSIALLRAVGVRTVVLHPDLAVGTPWQDVARRPTQRLALEKRLVDGVVVFELAPRSNAAAD